MNGQTQKHPRFQHLIEINICVKFGEFLSNTLEQWMPQDFVVT